MSTIPDPATTKWVPLQGKAPFNYYGQYSGARTYYDGDCAIGTDGILYLCVKDGTTTPPDAWPGAQGPAGPAGMGSDLRYDGSWVAGSYTDGDIVVGADGLTYICVRPTSAAPVPWASTQYPGKPTYGTTLPANPIDGQEAILVDSVTNPTYEWRFRYNAGSTSTYKWEFVGGSIASVYYVTMETQGVGWVNAVNPIFDVPRSGEYLVGFTSMFYSTAPSMLVGTNIAIAGSMSNVQQHANLIAGVQYATVSSAPIVMPVSAGQRLSHIYYLNQGVCSVLNRTLTVQPRRVS